MYLADAYPNSDISAGAMMAIAFVMVAVLAFWLIMVYVAAREPRQPRGQQAGTQDASAAAAPDGTAADEHSEAGQHRMAREHGAAA